MMNILSPFRIAALSVGIAVVAADLLVLRLLRRDWKLSHLALGVLAAGNLALVAYLFTNHVTFPLHLDLMEGTVLEHLRRAVAGDPIYPEPGPEYVPFAYNPLYYILTTPFTWLLGVNLTTLRLVSMLGTVLSAAMLMVIVRGRTGSSWWGLLAAGLFAGGYRTMDAYLDTAHSDSWMLATTLLGFHLLDRSRTAGRRLTGCGLLVASFWFKQHGAIFALAGLLYLAFRDGVRKAWPAWALATVLGPALYLLGGPWLFGPRFHYFTFEVPSRWSEFSLAGPLRVAGFLASAYLVLGAAALFRAVENARRRHLDLLTVGWMAALLTGLMGALDSGSSNNVFIPMGTWTILTGVLGLHALSDRPVWRRWRLAPAALLASFALLVYNPLNVRTSPDAERSYADLLGFLEELDGSVYAPYIGQLPSGYRLHPAAHWVALEDLVRGPGRDTYAAGRVVALLAPAMFPDGEAWVLTNLPLEKNPAIAVLLQSYELAEDLEDRFQPLRVLPARWDHGWPRYLYRYVPPDYTVH